MYKWNLRLCRRLLWRRFHLPQWVHYPVSFCDFPKHRTWGLSLGLEEEGHSQVTVKIVQNWNCILFTAKTCENKGIEFMGFHYKNQYLLLKNRLSPPIHLDSAHSRAARITFNLDRSLSDADYAFKNSLAFHFLLLQEVCHYIYAQILFSFFILFAWRIVFKETLKQIFTCITKAQGPVA